MENEFWTLRLRIAHHLAIFKRLISEADTYVIAAAVNICLAWGMSPSLSIFCSSSIGRARLKLASNSVGNVIR